MDPGAGRTVDRLVLVFGNIWIIIQLVLDVEAGCRASEDELTHLFNLMTPATSDRDLAQEFAVILCRADRSGDDSRQIPDLPAVFVESGPDVQ
jgi:hypothetical protein